MPGFGVFVCALRWIFWRSFPIYRLATLLILGAATGRLALR